MLYCCELRKRFSSTHDCCISCHEDDDVGYDMCFARLVTGEEIYVCCYVRSWLDESGKLE